MKVRQPLLDVKELAGKSDNNLYMDLITRAFKANDADAFVFYSRFYVQHLYWTMVRKPVDGAWIYEEADVDKRLKSMDFHVDTDQRRQAFRAFLEFM